MPRIVVIASAIAAQLMNNVVESFVVHQSQPISTRLLSSDKEWTSDFDDFYNDDSTADDDAFRLPKEMLSKAQADEPPRDELLESLQAVVSAQDDKSGMQSRQFLLGQDFILSGFAGSMGFDQVTDWEYYRQDEDTGERKVVEPPPLDPSKPKRTRERVGSVIRIFRGEWSGPLAAALRAQGLDSRILIKEFSGDMALDLAQAELASLAKLQSSLVEEDYTTVALARSANIRKDNANVVNLLQRLGKDAQWLGILGEVNLAELESDGVDPNEWYRALSVPPPKSGSVWVVYEYAGLSTAQQYCQPALVRRANVPPKRGVFGNIVEPPRLPPWSDRANYVVQGIIKGALGALANLHDLGICHGSIGRTSLLLTSTSMDKTEAASPYATQTSMLRIKLADFGFSRNLREGIVDDELQRRARGFGLSLKANQPLSEQAQDFLRAEDLHALGLVVLGLLLTSLAEPPSVEYSMPSTDDETLQRQLKDIFSNDMLEFREYLKTEDEVWSQVVQLLDERDGWNVLSKMCLAREAAADPSQETVTAKQLLESSLFQ